MSNLPTGTGKTSLPTDKARQGRSGKPVLIILVCSLVLLAIIFVGLGFYGTSLPDENLGPETATGAVTPPAAPAENASGPAGATTAPGGAPARTETGVAN